MKYNLLYQIGRKSAKFKTEDGEAARLIITEMDSSSIGREDGETSRKKTVYAQRNNFYLLQLYILLYNFN